MLIYFNLLPNKTLKMPDHRPVFRYTPRHIDGLFGDRLIKQCISDVICQSFAKAVTNGLQSVPLLLRMYQVRLCKNRAPCSDVWDMRSVLHGQVRQVGGIIEHQSERLLIKKASRTSCT